jgi:hypothetical protein
LTYSLEFSDQESPQRPQNDPGNVDVSIETEIVTTPELQSFSAKEFIEKTNNEQLIDHFFNILTHSSLELSSTERIHAGLAPDPSKVQPWLFKQSGRHQSTPYQVTVPEDEPPPPKAIDVKLPPQSVKDEVSPISNRYINTITDRARLRGARAQRQR